MTPSANQPSRVVALIGPRGCGKSALARAVQAALGPDQCTVFSLDRFAEDGGARAAEELTKLSHGSFASCPSLLSDHHAATRFYDAPAPAPLILVEGAPPQFPPEMAPLITHRWLIKNPERENPPGHLDPGSVQVFDSTHPLSVLVEEALVRLKDMGLTVPPIEAELLLAEDYCKMAARMGMEALGKRMERQARHWAGFDHQGEGIFFFERWVPVDRIAEFMLDALGLGRIGRRGARALKVEQHTVTSPAVPPDLDGFTLLQLSDLHLDLETGVVEALMKALPPLHYDVAVITGDYRNSTRDTYAQSIAHTGRLRSALKGPVFGILGNHDFIEMAPALEAGGIRLLMNEAVFIERGNARVFLAGIDDPHYYRTHNLERFTHRPPENNEFRILLSHSPETWREAARAFDLMLSGHTHGGQICLPGGIPLVRNGHCPARLLAGPWQEGTLHGYTSRGTGCCGVPMRFFCPPEITLHTLRSAPRA